MQKRKNKLDVPVGLPPVLTPKFIKKLSVKCGLNYEETSLLLRKYIGYLHRKKGGDFNKTITPRQLIEVNNKKNQLILKLATNEAENTRRP